MFFQDQLIASEKQRRLQRLRPHFTNDVWTRRDKPPDNWASPLPKWMQDEHEKSFLHNRLLMDKNKKEGKASSCSIM